MFFSSRRPPPSSTPFPYTTLFRSDLPGGRGGRSCSRGRRAGAAGRLPERAAPAGGSQGTGRDRKSTRLNSSHVAISYAVFCLKKKIEFNLQQVYSCEIDVGSYHRS